MTATTIPAVDRPYEDIDISSIAFWGQTPDVRDQSFAKLRAKGGVTWHPPVEAQPIPATSAGFWAVTTHAGVVEVSRDPERFSSTQTSPSIYEAGPDIMGLVAGFGGMDAPEHTRFRRLVSKASTPKQLARTDGLIAKRSKLAVDAVLDAGPCDFVEVFSNYVPAQVITDMVGVDDPEVREQLVEGPHYCLGSNLARVETRIALTDLLTRIPTLRAVRPEVRASSPMVNSIEHQMCEWD